MQLFTTYPINNINPIGRHMKKNMDIKKIKLIIIFSFQFYIIKIIIRGAYEYFK